MLPHHLQVLLINHVAVLFFSQQESRPAQEIPHSSGNANRVNIGLVCPYDLARPGGVRSHIVGLGGALQRRGHQVCVIGLGDGDAGPLEVLRCGSTIGARFSGTQIDFTWAGLKDLRRVLSRRFDLLHFHTIWNPFMPLQLAAVYRGPKVTTFHDVPGPATPIWARLAMPALSTAIRKLLVHEVIGVSPSAAAHLHKKNFTLIPNGLEAPPQLEESRQDFVLFLGRLEPRKGLEVLLRALAHLGPHAPALKIAGDGYLRADMEALARQLGLTRIEFLGEVDEARKWQLLHQARLLCVPSLGGESFGIVLTEAMACGTPVLAAANAGYSLVLQEKPELLSAVGDSHLLAERISALLGDPQHWQQLQAWGLQEWRRYDWDRLVLEVEAVYQKALR